MTTSDMYDTCFAFLHFPGLNIAAMCINSIDKNKHTGPYYTSTAVLQYVLKHNHANSSEKNAYPKKTNPKFAPLSMY